MPRIVYFKFNKKLLISAIIASLGLILLLSLSVWQLSRYYTKKNILTDLNYANEQVDLNSKSLISLYNQLEFDQFILTVKNRKFKTSLDLNNNFIFLIDNKTYQNQAGYYLLVPARINSNHTDIYILANLGWFAQGASRAVLPNFDNLIINQKINQISGQLTSLPRPVFNKELSLTEHKLNSVFNLKLDSQIYRLDYFSKNNYFEVSQVLTKTILPVIWDISEEYSKNSLDLYPTAKMQSWLTPQRHLGYALQWFLLAVCYVFVVYNLFKVKFYRKI